MMFAIIQARLSSKRFPRKVLKKINGMSVLEHIIQKMKKIFPLKKIIVATSKNKEDTAICKLAKNLNVRCFRGDLKNVSKRYYDLLDEYQMNSFLRVCADSPFLDPKLIKKCIKIYNLKKPNFLTNILPRSFPKGQSVEIFDKKFFQKNFSSIKKSHDKEHVTTYFYSNKYKFRYINIKNKIDFSKINMCIDHPDDLKHAKRIISKTKVKNKIQTWEKLLKYFIN
ncbi:hypothetical protein IDH20_02180 [Pelagibacterales bacterium SAG-MED39]|nr:hypothetical protein [Pelagibacterales bacterium SAG-MED39]